MEPEDEGQEGEAQSVPMAALNEVFQVQLVACLEECSQGRRGLFSAYEHLGEDDWPEASRLRELAAALQSIAAQDDERNALCAEFLDLCSMHGESNPGEPRLARSLIKRIESGAVGTPTQKEQRPWGS